MGFMGFPSLGKDFLMPLFMADKAREGQREQNEYNAAQAQKQQDFQAHMSSTAYQRSTQDMKKSGINPMLAFMKGGASSPGGASSTGVSPTTAAVQAFNDARAKSMTNMDRAAIAKLDSETKLTNAKTKIVESEVPKADTFSHIWEKLGNSAKDILNKYPGDKPLFNPGGSYLDKKVIKGVKEFFGTSNPKPNRNPRSGQK